LKFRVRFTPGAEADLIRLYEFILERDATGADLAERAPEAIPAAIGVLERFPFTCRKASPDNPFLRELVVRFGGAGCVALFDVSEAVTVTVTAGRRQREDDYH
jgi:plasmid stabilization system protein ParE